MKGFWSGFKLWLNEAAISKSGLNASMTGKNEFTFDKENQ